MTKRKDQPAKPMATPEPAGAGQTDTTLLPNDVQLTLPAMATEAACQLEAPDTIAPVAPMATRQADAGPPGDPAAPVLDPPTADTTRDQLIAAALLATGINQADVFRITVDVDAGAIRIITRDARKFDYPPRQHP